MNYNIQPLVAGTGTPNALDTIVEGGPRGRFGSGCRRRVRSMNEDSTRRRRLWRRRWRYRNGFWTWRGGSTHRRCRLHRCTGLATVCFQNDLQHLPHFRVPSSTEGGKVLQSQL